MRYAVYFTWNDGTEDSFNVEGREELDFNVNGMIARKEFSQISYCRIYASGEYGEQIDVYKDNNRRRK